MERNATTHMWFMYPLIGLILVAPFLSKLLHALSERELRLLWAIGIIWNIFKVWLTSDLGVGFSYSGYLFDGWTIYFFFGYYCARCVNEKNRKLFYFSGLLGFFLTSFLRVRIADHRNYAWDLSPLFMLFVIAAFVFLERSFQTNHKSIVATASFFSSYSFYIYLIHYDIVLEFNKYTGSMRFGYLVSITLTLLLSLAVAVILRNIVIRPLLFLLDCLERRIDPSP